MYSSSREEAVAAFDNLDTALNRVLKVSPDDLTIPECLAMLQRCEKIRRRLPAAEHPFINKLADQTDQTELGGKLPFALAERLHISRGEASRRIHEAADLGPRRTLTGQPLPPLLTATAAAHAIKGRGIDRQRRHQLTTTYPNSWPSRRCSWRARSAPRP